MSQTYRIVRGSRQYRLNNDRITLRSLKSASMAITIENPAVQAMAEELARLTGCSPSEAVETAIVAALKRAQSSENSMESLSLRQRLNNIALRCAALPNVDKDKLCEAPNDDDSGLPC